MKVLNIIWKIILGIGLLFNILAIMSIGLGLLIELGDVSEGQVWYITIVTSISACSLLAHFLRLCGWEYPNEKDKNLIKKQ